MNRKALGFCALAIVGALGFSAAPAMAGTSYDRGSYGGRIVARDARVTISIGNRGYERRHVHSRACDRDRRCDVREVRRDRGRHAGWYKNRGRGC